MANSVPTLTGLTTPVNFLENTVNATPQIIDADVTFTDADNNFDTGVLTVTGLLAQDTVAIRNQGTGAGEIGVAGSDITFGGSVIGSFAGGGGSTLTVTFNAAATAPAIEALIENLTYANSADTPSASRSLELKVTDAAGFAAIAPLAFVGQTGAANPLNGIDVGNFSAASFADLDGDGDLDAVVGDDLGRLDYFQNIGTAIAPAFTEQTGAANPFDGVDFQYRSTPSFADLDGDGDFDAIVGDNNGTLHYFQNTGSATAPVFTERTGAANPLNGGVGYYSAPAFADLDGDGDLDALVGDLYGILHYFQNTGSATAPAFTERTGAANPFDGVDVGFLGMPSFADIDGDGDPDAVVGAQDGTLRYFANTGTAIAPAFTLRAGAANPFNGVDVGNDSAPVFADLDGDGDLNVVSGEVFGTLRYFANTTPHQPAADFAEQTGAANPFVGLNVGNLSTPVFADLDGDGDLDAVVGENNGPLHYFKNTGSATAPAFTAQAGAANPFNGVNVGAFSTPSFADLDGDGDLDAVAGNSDGTLHYLENTGSATSPAFTERTGAANPFDGVDVVSRVTPVFADLDGDGDLDAVIGTLGGTLRYFENTGSATAPAFTARTGAANPFDGLVIGGASAPSFADLDGDGDLDLVVGAQNGTLRYFENTGAGFTQVVNVTAQNDTPVANAQSLGTDKDTAIAATLSGSDADNDSLTFAVLSGPAHGTLSGSGANRTYTPDAGYLGPDSFSYVANDGTLNSAAATVSLNVHMNIAPVVTAFDQSAARGQVFNASALFSATDGDGDTLLYFFWDNNPDPASGYFTVNGVVQAAHTTFAVNAAQLALTTFTAGQLPDGLFVNAWDFSLFSGPQEFHVNVPANQAPTVTAPDFSASKGQVVSASDLFTANDANGDPLLYFFYDNSADPASGHFTVNGAVQAAGTTFAVTAAQLATTTFTAGTAVSDGLFVNAWDGIAFSGPKEFHVHVVNNAPTVTASNQTASSGQVLTASSLFTANDADGDSLLYFFYDNSAAATSGHFEINGVTQAAGTTFAVLQAQLANTTFVAGTTGDDLFVNVWDQASFSGPKAFHIDIV